jgi:diguanylate cyclase (GGDEF)-like protein
MPHSRTIVAKGRKKPPIFGDESVSALSNANYALAGAVLLFITPLVIAITLAIPAMARFSIEVLVVLDALAAITIVVTWRGHPTAGSVVLAVGSWIVFTAAMWFTGGLSSATVVGLFLVVVFTSLTLGWQGGAAASALGVLTVLIFAVAENSGTLPPDVMTYSPWMQAAAYATFFVALGILQAILTASVQRSRDVAAREARERRIAEKRLLDVIDNAPFGAIVCTLDRRGVLRVVQVNRTASDVLGVEGKDLLGKPIPEALSALSGETVLITLEQVAADGGGFHSGSVPFYADGRSGSLELHAFQIGANSVAVFFTDVTARRRQQFQFHQMAFHDELTKLPNRKLLLDRMGVALASAKRRGTEVALFFIDLDNFKPINDKYGHAFGDQLLMAVARRLSSNARASDTVARLGGDEFTVLMTDITAPDQVDIVARKLVAALAEPFDLDSVSLRVTASIGVSITTPEEREASKLLDRADTAMYQAKRAGRNSYRIC